MKDNVLKLVSPIPPSWNHYLGWRAIMKGKTPIVVSYLTKEAKEYKEYFKKYVLEEVKKQGWNMEVNKTQHFYIDAVFYFDRVDKDSSNYDKCLLDSITDTKAIWEDDNVALFRPNKVCYDPKNPRIEMEIYPVEYIGIFDNEECLSSFEEKCKTCNRYKRNCSILKNAKSGRIQEEINKDFECSKYKEAK